MTNHVGNWTEHSCMHVRPYREMTNRGRKRRKELTCEPEVLLLEPAVTHSTIVLKKGQAIFSQGDITDAVFYVQRGKVKLAVTSKSGKEATIAFFEAGSFLGEESIIGAQPQRLATATTLTQATILRIERKEMIRVLHDEPSFSQLFVTHLLARNSRIQADLVDQLFNSSEKRLARALLQLAQFGKDGAPEKVIPKISQKMLAAMIGTTRSRVSLFMNRFRKCGFIEYNGKLTIHSSLLNVVIHE
jgi:CRP/FNR family transcriptional regulator, cyclic AMP receptor protein